MKTKNSLPNPKTEEKYESVFKNKLKEAINLKHEKQDPEHEEIGI
jgi:hypothetical protein